jgi:hypothetical protein
VHGVCQGGKTIQAENFYTFTNQKFDAKSHNTLCKLMNSIPNVYHKPENNNIPTLVKLFVF